MSKTPVKTSAIFDDCTGISHGFFSRHGGVSTGKYTSLNTGRGSDDNPAHILENRTRVAGVFNIDAPNLLSVHQHHSTDVITATAPWNTSSVPKADAIVTNAVGLACSAMSADCSPVLFADPVARIVGAAHAGWRGALNGVTDTTIAAMCALGAKPENIRASIGPCLGQTYFEVGPEFVDMFCSERSENEKRFTKGRDDRSYFDIKTYIKLKLQRAGVKLFDALPECTYTQNTDYFSYRHNCHNGIEDYGRNISAIVIDS